MFHQMETEKSAIHVCLLLPLKMGKMLVCMETETETLRDVICVTKSVAQE